MITKKEKTAFFMLLVYVVYLLYYFADMATSANTMVKQTESRTEVHLYLVILIGLLALYFLSRKKWKLDDGFRGSLFAMIAWCVVTDMLVGAAFWGIATHVGLLVLFYLIYYFGGHYVSSERRYKMVIALEFILWVITLWFSINAYFSFREYNGEDKDVVLNMAYNILVFVPFLLQLKNRMLKFVTVGISMVYIVVSLKRGAIVALMMMLIVFYYFGDKRAMRNSFRINRKNIRRILLTVAAMIVVMAVVDKQTGGALSERFSADALRDGSNRSELYLAAWQDIKSRGLFSLLIGKGSGSSLRIIGAGVHNELLEFLFSYGIIGLCAYIFFIYKGFKHVNWVGKHGAQQRQTFAIGFTYIVVVGFVGSALFSHMTFHIMLAMGMVNSPVGVSPKEG